MHVITALHSSGNQNQDKTYDMHPFESKRQQTIYFIYIR